MNDPSTARKAPCGGGEGEKVDSGERKKRGKKKRRGWRVEKEEGEAEWEEEVEEEGRRKGIATKSMLKITSEQMC